MQVTKVTVGFSCKMSKNFNSVEAHVELEAEITEYECEDSVIAYLHEQAKAAVKQQLIDARVAKVAADIEEAGY